MPMLVCYSLVQIVPERPATTSPLSDSGARPRAKALWLVSCRNLRAKAVSGAVLTCMRATEQQLEELVITALDSTRCSDEVG